MQSVGDERGSLGAAKRSLDTTSKPRDLPSIAGIGQEGPAETSTLDPAHPGVWTAPAVSTSAALYAASFGLTGEKIAIRPRERLLDCFLCLDQAYLDTPDLDVTSLLSENVDVIYAGCSEKVAILIQSTSYFSAAMVVGFILSPRLAESFSAPSFQP
ncbi:hypothetical protein LTR81_020065 [Elasticomyces elasticus]